MTERIAYSIACCYRLLKIKETCTGRIPGISWIFLPRELKAREEESEGLDSAEHGGTACPGFGLSSYAQQ